MIVFAVERNCVRSAITLGSVGGIRTAGLLACAAYITLVSSTGFPADVRAKNPPATLSAAERKQLATERDALVEKSKVLQAQGKLKEAIAATKDALAIERRVFGDLSDDVALSIERIGQFHLTLDEFTEARQAVEQARAILAKQHSKDHWRLTDARLILEDIQLHERLTPEQRKELAKADLVDAQALQLFQKGDFAQSIQSEARALEI